MRENMVVVGLLVAVVFLLGLFGILVFACIGKDDTCQHPVCGFDGLTYNCADEAHSAGTGVLHCGHCGACSNYNDVWIYNITRNNLTEASKQCATFIFLSEEAVTECFNQNIGFTEECTACWVENVVCDNENCLGPCLECELKDCPSTYPNGSLNTCLQCDEDKCGPGFMSCAGANRRGSCIVSDIERDEGEICTLCDPWPEGWSQGEDQYTLQLEKERRKTRTNKRRRTGRL